MSRQGDKRKSGQGDERRDDKRRGGSEIIWLETIGTREKRIRDKQQGEKGMRDKVTIGQDMSGCEDEVTK